MQHSQYVPEADSIPPLHAGVHSEYSSTAPLAPPGGPSVNPPQDEEVPFSPPELIPSVGVAPLSHDDRQVSIASCSNLVIDEQSSGATATAGGGFPTASSATPTDYAPVEFDSGAGKGGGNHPDNQQGFTPFVLAPEAIGGPAAAATSQEGVGGSVGPTSMAAQEASCGAEKKQSSEQLHQGEGDKKEPSSKLEASTQGTTNKGKSPKPKRHYNAYSSDDDDDVFLPNPPPKSQADRCTIAMETNDEKSTVVKEMEMEPSTDKEGDAEDEGTLMIDESGGGDVVNDHDSLGVVATETEEEGTATEEEVDVLNDSRTEDEEAPVNLSLSAPNPGTNINTGLLCYFEGGYGRFRWRSV